MIHAIALILTTFGTEIQTRANRSLNVLQGLTIQETTSARLVHQSARLATTVFTISVEFA
jgi:hypothetical protein